MNNDTNLLDQLHAVRLRLILALVLDDIPRVFLDVDLDPNEHPRLGSAHARIAGGSDLGFEEVEQEVPSPFVLLR